MTLTSIINQSIDAILDLIYPPQCVNCNAPGAYFCAQCQQQLSHITAPVCPKCGYPQTEAVCHQCQHHPLQHIDSIHSAAFFEGPLRTAIHKLKYEYIHTVSRWLAPLLANTYTTHHLAATVIVPVPLHKKRYKERGYNQSAMLANHLGQLIQLPVNTKTLVRQRATQSQMTLNAHERQQNVADAFECTSNKLAYETVLLIDDVSTTGATLDACAKALKQTNVNTVFGLTLGRAR